jgi:hypothetical protein
MNLADITGVAERVISDDLEYLISKAVNVEKADYAVITGVQIHNWSTDLSGANFEFVAPTKCYVVVNGEKTVVDLSQVPPLTPRQLNVIAGETAGLEAGISRWVWLPRNQGARFRHWPNTSFLLPQALFCCLLTLPPSFTPLPPPLQRRRLHPHPAVDERRVPDPGDLLLRAAQDHQLQHAVSDDW